MTEGPIGPETTRPRRVECLRPAGGHHRRAKGDGRGAPLMAMRPQSSRRELGPNVGGATSRAKGMRAVPLDRQNRCPARRVNRGMIS